MKEILEIYYDINLEVDQIDDDKFFFVYRNKGYVIIKLKNYEYLNNDILNSIYYQLNIPILNKYNEYVTIHKDNSYLLFYNYDGILFQDNILYFLNQPYKNVNIDLKTKWCEKIDFHEYQMLEFSLKYPLLNESINYVNGLAEIGIQLLNKINLNYCYTCYGHKRITSSLFDFYNPINIVEDYRIRDISEYIKYNFFHQKYSYMDFLNLISKINLNNEEFKLLFVRLLFITPYYDMFEDIILGLKDEINIKKIVHNFDNYEQLLVKIYNYILLYTNIDKIEFFIR